MMSCSTTSFTPTQKATDNQRHPSSNSNSCAEISSDELKSFSEQLSLVLKQVENGSEQAGEIEHSLKALLKSSSPELNDRLEMELIRLSIQKIYSDISKDSVLSKDRESFLLALVNRVDIIKKYTEETENLFHDKKLWESKVRLSGTHLQSSAKVLINSIKNNRILSDKEKSLLYDEINIATAVATKEVNTQLEKNVARFESQVHLVRNSAVVMGLGVVALGAAYYSPILGKYKLFNGMIVGSALGPAAVLTADTSRAISDAYQAKKMDNDAWCAMRDTFTRSDENLATRLMIASGTGALAGYKVLPYLAFGSVDFVYGTLASLVIATGSILADSVVKNQLINEGNSKSFEQLINNHLAISEAVNNIHLSKKNNLKSVSAHLDGLRNAMMEF
jgi:hypothetical protein